MAMILLNISKNQGNPHIFVWSEVQTTGIGAFDHDHHLISVALGILDNCLALSARCEVFENTVEFISEHVHQHFLREELVMERLGYPDLKDHETEHARMREWMGENFSTLKAAPVNKCRERLNDLHDWWCGHTQIHDAAYSGFLLPHAFEARAIISQFNLA